MKIFLLATIAFLCGVPVFVTGRLGTEHSHTTNRVLKGCDDGSCNTQNPDEWCVCEGGDGAVAEVGRVCYASFVDDCLCSTGYMLTSDGCQFCNHDNRDTWCRDQGGDGAIAREGQDCYDSFEDDCLCAASHRKTSDGCEDCNHDDRDSWCRGEGGEGAYGRPGQDCYHSFEDDCLCLEGYTLTNSGCQFCNLDNRDAWCRDQGGDGAFAKDGQDCYASFEDDCICLEGYTHDSESCEYNCNDDDPNDWCRSVGGAGAFAREDVDCWDDFSLHCGCFDDFLYSETGCNSSIASPGDTQVRYVGDDSYPETAYPMKICEGDCDDDSDCEGSLVCFERSSGNIAVPGCVGGEDESSDHDYCYDPSSPLPTEAPVTVAPIEEPATVAPLPTEEPATVAPGKPGTLPQLSEEGRSNTTQTVYEFVGGNVVEAGCSFAQTGVVAACRAGQIRLLDVSHPSIVCNEPSEYEDGSARFSCNNTCIGNACQGALLVTKVSEDYSGNLTMFGLDSEKSELGEVHFLCESAESGSNQTNNFVCGASGIVPSSSSMIISTSVYNVGTDKDFRWGLFGSDFCLDDGQSTKPVISSPLATMNPDLEP